MADTLFKMRVEGVASVKADLDLTKVTIRAEVEKAVWTNASSAVAQAKANLSGGVLKKFSGQTAGAVRAFPLEGQDFMTANVGVGPEGFRGKFWERGFKGSQAMKAHLRSIKTGNRLEVMKVSRKGRVSRLKVFETGAVEVSAYHRNVDGSPRPWLAPAVDSVRSSFYRAIQDIADKKREV